MPVYLKIEESYATQDVSLRQDLMGISLLALFLSPWALIGLTLSIFGVNFITPAISVTCMATIIVAIPQALHLFRNNKEHIAM